MDEYTIDVVGSTNGSNEDYGLEYTFRNKISHAIDFCQNDRFLEKVVVKFW